jgi:type I site-specific restriction-modification system R (restriction) subunit
LHDYLSTDITFEILANFLRQNSAYQKCFQIAHSCCGKPRYIEAEKVYSYEHTSKFKVSDSSRANILHDIDEDEFYPEPIHNRLILDEIEKVFKTGASSLSPQAFVETLKQHLNHQCFNVDIVMQELLAFCTMKPRLPDTAKSWDASQVIAIKNNASREEVIEYLESIRSTNAVADLAFAAYRDMTKTPWKPFVKAAMERNPVSVRESATMDVSDIAAKLTAMDAQSIYDGKRMAQPDEVWNYSRGDGLEKALCLMNCIRSRFPDDTVTLKGDGSNVVVCHGSGKEYSFTSSKQLVLPDESDFLL